jgi:hypothetical protein
VKRSAKLLLVQKNLYEMLLGMQINHLPNHWITLAFTLLQECNKDATSAQQKY